ncbi:MAG: hypothetical protein NUV65_06030, partial [Candidatus Roizmanbacteria bacterium]|nr:hypothetical protein [Candidatus Roizmanbacteria bacterium]
MNIASLFTTAKLQEYMHTMSAKRASVSSIKRKLTSVLKLAQWAKKAGNITAQEYSAFEQELSVQRSKILGNNSVIARSAATKQSVQTQSLRGKNDRSNIFQRLLRYARNDNKNNLSFFQSFVKERFSNLLPLFLIVAFAVGAGIGIYNQFFQKAKVNLAYPATFKTSSRKINFQGLLTDSGSTPITSAIHMRFQLYDAASGGNLLYDTDTDYTGDSLSCSGVNQNPDQDGIVNVLVGQDCGDNIPDSVFSQYGEVWMGVTVGADPEMTPRQQIANVPYAINSETLQGLPPGTGKSNIPFINRDGDLLIATASPGVRSTYASTTFQISSANALTFVSAGSGDITLNATQSGTLKLQTAGTGGNQVSATNANLNTGNLYYGAVANDGTVFNLMQLQSGSSLTTKFSLSASGIGYFASNVGIGSASPTEGLDIATNPRIRLAQASAPGTVNDKLYNVSGNLYWAGSQLNSAGGTLPTGTNGQTLRSNGTNWLANSTLYNDGTNVGIGTTVPGYKLDIAGNLGGGGGKGVHIQNTLASGYSELVFNNDNSRSDGTFVFGYGGSTATSAQNSGYFWNRLSGNILFGTNNTEQVRIDASGNVGVGTTAPVNRLSVISTTSPQFRIGYDNTTNYFTSAVSSTGAVTFDTNGSGAAFSFADGVTANTFASSGVTITGGTINNTSIGATTKSTGAFTTLSSTLGASFATTSGNVGIGSASPVEGLDLAGSNPRLRIAQASAPGTTTDKLYNVSGNLFWNGTNLTGGGSLPSGTNGQTIYNNGGTWATSSNLYHNGTNVGIGTTNPLFKLDVSGTARFTGNVRLDSLAAGSTDSVITESSGVLQKRTIDSRVWGSSLLDYSGTNTNYVPYFSDANTLTKSSIYYDGTNVGIGTSAPSNQLDIFGTSSALRFSYNTSNYSVFNVGTDGGLTLNSVTAGGASTQLASFATSGNTFDVPTSFTSSGDVSIANDLQFTNQTASYIKSNAPLYIQVGEAFESNDLTLKTYNSGNIVLDAGDTTSGTGTVQFSDSNVKGATTTTAIPFASASTDVNTFRTNYTNQNILGALNEVYTAATGGGGGIWTLTGLNLYPTLTTYNIGIGTSSAGTNKLRVVGGTTSLEGATTVTTGGLTVSSGGASITGGINNNTGGITNAGAISGGTAITSSG